MYKTIYIAALMRECANIEIPEAKHVPTIKIIHLCEIIADTENWEQVINSLYIKFIDRQ